MIELRSMFFCPGTSKLISSASPLLFVFCSVTGVVTLAVTDFSGSSRCKQRVLSHGGLLTTRLGYIAEASSHGRSIARRDQELHRHIQRM